MFSNPTTAATTTAATAPAIVCRNGKTLPVGCKNCKKFKKGKCGGNSGGGNGKCGSRQKCRIGKKNTSHKPLSEQSWNEDKARVNIKLSYSQPPRVLLFQKILKIFRSDQ